MDPSPTIDVVIPAYNRREETLDCVQSLLASSGVPLNIVVVDNGSTDGTGAALRSAFGDRIRVLRSEVNLYAGGGRNLGAAQGRAPFILFVDSDNIVDPAMAAELLEGFRKNSGAGMGLCGPFMYYAQDRDRLCWVRGDINLWTSLTWWEGLKEMDRGQYDGLPYIPVGHIPNVFMMERSIFERLGGFDPLYEMHYEESDLAERVKRLGFRCVLFPRAKTWHRVPLEKPKGDRQFSGANPGLLFRSVRNRILFMRRFGSALQVAVFFVLFGPLLLGYQLVMSVINRQPGLCRLILRGYWEGWRIRDPGGKRV